MQALSQFVKHVPENSLENYFKHQNIDIDSLDEKSDAADYINNVITHLNPPQRTTVYADMERIAEMTDELGQLALLNCITDRHTFKSKASHYDRTLWAFLHETTAFRRAEGIRASDYYRQGRLWSGFSVPPNRPICIDAKTKDIFEIEVKAHFDTEEKRRVLADIFKRSRHDKDIYQLTLYREGLSTSELVFVDKDHLESQQRYPVHESTITYEPQTGALDVVSRTKEERQYLAQLFTRTFLQSNVTGQHPLLRSYHLDKLLSPCQFDTDPEDGICEVKITLLQLKHYENTNGSLELTSLLKNKHDIYTFAKECYGLAIPFTSDFFVKKVKLAIRFERDQGERCARVIPCTISHPNGCNLKSRTEKEQLIANKYLPRWGLIREVSL